MSKEPGPETISKIVEILASKSGADSELLRQIAEGIAGALPAEWDQAQEGGAAKQVVSQILNRLSALVEMAADWEPVRTAQAALEKLASEDPDVIHYAAVREAAPEADNASRDDLARLLVEHIGQFLEQLEPLPEQPKPVVWGSVPAHTPRDLFDDLDAARAAEDESAVRATQLAIEDHFENRAMLWIDAAGAEYLATIGASGKQLATELIVPRSQKRWALYLKEGAKEEQAWVEEHRDLFDAIEDAERRGDSIALQRAEDALDAAIKADDRSEEEEWANRHEAFTQRLRNNPWSNEADEKLPRPPAYVASERALWKLWIPDPPALYPPFAYFLATALWKDVVEPGLSARPLSVHVVTVGEDGYAKIPKGLAPISWAAGGQGEFLEIDGSRFVKEPTGPRVGAIAIPRSWEVVQRQKGSTKPSEQVLPLRFPGTDPLPLAIVGQAGSHPSVLSPHAGKLALLLLASATTPKIVVSDSLEALARGINPNARTIQPTHLKSTAKGLLELYQLEVVNPDNWTRIRCFDMRVPLDLNKLDKQQPIEWKLGGLFLDDMRRQWLTSPNRDSYAGWFVINLDGAMRLDARRDADLRHYIRAAVSWNDAHGIGPGKGFEPDRMPWFPVERWLALANSLSARAADAIAGERKSKGSRQGRYLDRKRGFETLDNLHDLGLIRIEKRGRSGELRPMPPEDLLEAWEGFKTGKGKRRPT